MPARKRRISTKRHGTRNFILQALETTRSGPAIATAAIIKQVRKLAGKRLPEETIRSSLKTLVRQRVVKGRKSGKEKVYRLAPQGIGGPPSPPGPAGGGPSVASPRSQGGPRAGGGPVPLARYTLYLEPSQLRWFREHPDVDPDASLRKLIDRTIDAYEGRGAFSAEADADSASALGLPPSASAAAPLPHKLAVGEVLVLAVHDAHVETASNVHGKVVLERHARPRLS